MDDWTDGMRCERCKASGWVCEEHTSRPWGGMCCDGPRRANGVRWLCRLLPYRGLSRLAWRIRVLCEHGACHCGGAGYACPSCNPPARVDGLDITAEASP